jgi:MinD-like ATPase involved in chromosome partitioning or flagellar assembly
MALQVFTAVTGAAWESELVGALDRADHGVTVVRRCVDVSELLAVAATGTGQAALLSAELRRLDSDAIARLEAAGVAVVGLVEPGDEHAADRLRQLGVRRVLPADAEPDEIAEALREAVGGAAASGRDVADPRAALPALGVPDEPEERPVGRGRLVAVWGPTGAPGRTTVAVGVADEAARLGVTTMLVDADVYGGVVAQVLGLLDESPGLAGAARLAATGQLDAAALIRLAWAVRPHLRVLTGLSRADRWPELRPRAVEAVLEEARRLAEVTVVDCSFSLEDDEELAFDTAAPRRSIRALDELRDVLPEVEPVLVVNQVRRGPVPGDAREEIATALERFAGREVQFFLPADRRATDAALASGRTLAEIAPASPLRTALRSLAAAVAEVSEPTRRRRLLGRNRMAG